MEDGNRRTCRKTLGAMREKTTNSAHMTPGRNRTHDTLVGSEWSHYYAITAPHITIQFSESLLITITFTDLSVNLSLCLQFSIIQTTLEKIVRMNSSDENLVSLALLSTNYLKGLNYFNLKRRYRQPVFVVFSYHHFVQIRLNKCSHHPFDRRIE